ncbi:MAG: GDP-mannose 4,6-dehydratase [Candidatus Paceibacterota bacterium]|jgi:GDPmannose 4,6-dehydratase
MDKKYIQNKPYNQRSALITGVTGQDGSYLAEFLLELGYKKVIGLRRRTSTFNTSRVEHIYENDRFCMEWGDMNDTLCLIRILQKWSPDEIYNLAAQSHVRVSFDVPEETLAVVGMGTLKLMNAYKEICPEARFYQASSSEMYGDNPTVPQDECTRMTPASPYACAKLYAHNLVRNYRISYNLHASCGILFNHESPRRGETFVTRKITEAAARIKLGLQDKLELGNLDAKRDWGFAGDYVKAMWAMLQQDIPDDYVIATGETHSVKEFLDATFQFADLSVDKHVQINSRLFRPHEVPVLLGDANKAKLFLGWKPEITFSKLIEMMYIEDLKQQAKLHNIDVTPYLPNQ